MRKGRTGLPKGRPKADPDLVTDAPSDQEILAMLPDLWVWVEGRVYVSSMDEKKRLIVDKVKQDLAMLGLVLQTQDGEVYGEDEDKRRRWTGRRVSIEDASAVLQNHPNGMTIPDFAKTLFYEKGWTELHLKAAVAKTYVVIHKLKARHLVTKGRGGLLFSTIKKGKDPIPPVLMAQVRTILSDMGEDEWPEMAVRKLILSILKKANEVGQ